MNAPPTSPPPGHYGAGYGEQVPADAPPRADSASTPLPPVDPVSQPAPATGTGTGTGSDDGAPVVFTPDDVGARPPDHTPTESAPESEKAGLIFERS